MARDMDERLKLLERQLDYEARMTPGVDRYTGGWEGEKLTIRELVILGDLTVEGDFTLTGDVTADDATFDALTITSLTLTTGNQAWQTSGITLNGTWTSGVNDLTMRWRIMPWGQVIIQGQVAGDNLVNTPGVLVMPAAARPVTNTQALYVFASDGVYYKPLYGTINTSGNVNVPQGVAADTVVEFPFTTYFLIG